MAGLNTHDIVTKKVLGEKIYAVDFLRSALPSKVVSKLDFSKLKVEKGNFIDAHNKERFTDILYSVPIRKASQKLGIFCLIEHKSTRDSQPAWRASIRLTNGLCPLVLYHGKEKWDDLAYMEVATERVFLLGYLFFLHEGQEKVTYKIA